MPLDWSPFVEFAQRHARFLLLTHVRPDGDALGSQLGMADALTQFGKSARCVIGSSFPERYRFMDPNRTIERFSETSDCFTWADAIVVLDTGTWNQLGECGPPLKARAVPKFVIDHHRTQDDLGATRLVNVDAEATGRLVWDAFRALGKTPSPAAASALFTALAMDTGWFHHSNMRPATFELAAALTAAGAEAHQIYEYLYERNSPARMRLQGRMLDRIKLEAGGRIAISEVYLSDYPETGAHPLDTEDFVQLLRAIDGVDVGLLLIEQITGEVKVSFRSREPVDVSKVAEAFGGGGHARAAGATAAGPIAAARTAVLAAVRAALP
jgi:phosphoesterase RecJ-like protein